MLLSRLNHVEEKTDGSKRKIERESFNLDFFF